MKDEFIFLGKGDKNSLKHLEDLSFLIRKDCENQDDNCIRLGLFVSNSLKDDIKSECNDFFDRLKVLKDKSIQYAFCIADGRNFRYNATVIELLSLNYGISISYFARFNDKVEKKNEILRDLQDEKIKLFLHSTFAKIRTDKLLKKYS